jgi:peptidoglycan hydrolase-like protein with peptidoglycan-binding domain
MLRKLKGVFVLFAMFVGSFLFSPAVLAASVNIVTFDTNGMSGGEVTMPATWQNANLSIVVLTRGLGLGIPSSPPLNTFASDSYVIGGVKNNAIVDGEYLQVEIGPKLTYKLSLSSIDVNLRRSSTGPQHYQWLYSLDGFGTPGIDIGFAETYTGTESNGTARPTINLSGIADLQNITAGTSVTFRLYAWGATNATGTFAIGRLAGDDLKFMGTVEQVTHTLTYSAGVNGSLTGDLSQVVIHGNDGTAVTAVPDSGYHFVDWSDGITDNPRQDLSVVEAINVTANFAINTYSLAYAAGVGGSLTGDLAQTVNHGADGTAVSTVPDVGYYFVDWSDASTDNPRQDLNVTGDIAVTANFAIGSYTLTYLTDGNGTITGASLQSVNHGSNGSAVSALANSGYKFVDWSDGVTTATRTDLNITGNLTVTARFRKLSSPILYVVVGTGTGLIDQAIPMYETKVVGRLDQGGINILSYLNGQANFEAKESKSGQLAWHHIKILNVDLNNRLVKIEVASVPQIFDLDLKEEIQVDLDADQIKDISIKFEDLVINRVELTVKSLLADILMPVVETPGGVVGAPVVSTCPANFTRDLKQNMSGADVKALQQYLNQQGFLVASVGAGSSGNETEYFGALTKSALEKYQKAKGISASFGEFDLATRVFLGCASLSVDSEQHVTGKHRYNRNLDLGMTGADVKELQKFLNAHGFVLANEGPGSPGNETEMFGSLTKKALARYQADQEIVPANGVFSDWTRWWLNKQ